MTYILVDKYKKQNASTSLFSFLSKLFNHPITTYDLDTNPDIHLLDPKDENSIGIEEIKNLQLEMRYKPFQEKFQIGIIVDAEKLTMQSQNALLKFLEDSTEESIYVLYVDNEKNLLPTILSRGRITYLQSETVSSPMPEFEILNMNIAQKFELVGMYYQSKDSAIDLINSLDQYFKEKLEVEIKNGNIDGSKRVAKSLQILDESRKKVYVNCNRRLILEDMMLRI